MLRTTTTCLAALCGAALTLPSLAADLPRRAASLAPGPAAFTQIPVFGWTGFYAGVNAGSGFGDGTRSFADATYGTVTPGDGRGGFVGGGQIGFNHQFTPGSGFVAGVEADIQGTTFGHRRAGLLGTVPYYDVGPSLDWFGTVRGRLGYAFDRFLVYGTAGFAYGGGRLPGFASAYAGTLPGTTRTGWTAGGGLEYAITDQFSAKIEGLYVNLDRRSGGSGVTYDSATSAFYGVSRSQYEFGLIRAGLNDRFSAF